MEDLVYRKDGKVVTDTLKMAQCFGKSHGSIAISVREMQKGMKYSPSLKAYFIDKLPAYNGDENIPSIVLTWEDYSKWVSSVCLPCSELDSRLMAMKYAFWREMHKDEPKVAGVVKVVKAVKSNEVGGDHYKMAMQPIDYIHANCMTFDEGNVVKYISRYKKKNGYEDLCKCVHYTLFAMQDNYGIKNEVINQIMEVLKNAEHK